MKKTIKIKTPISYYGGKQSMLKYILPIIPKHKLYIEPFFGGGAVFFGKEKSEVEIINDYNANVSNFYYQLKTNYDELKTMIDATLYSRDTYRNALVVYENPFIFKPIVRAWAFWVATIQGFSNKIGSWRSSSDSNKSVLCFDNKKINFTKSLTDRLKYVQIENKDTVELIKRFDSEESFFYLDPPYVDSNQGHYGGYTQEHFDELLNTLTTLRGKFLLSSYPNNNLNELRLKHGWFSSDKNMSLSISATKGKRKIECLTANFEF